ncbi:YciI family protein [Labilibaculum sp. DW002]|uniref:YciI family protein n=1 Tax=Paralabilibaculum antarcticum TaxID=2912572 RepID=A0ABT5VXF5_9BACT|nr:YciI family protein [Labilibaculum sp. DW002]MDE5420097.1 YciI family protein [Labilibaculum sp. DW002]
MFIISLTYKVPLEKVEAELNNHVQYLKEQYALGNFKASGRKVPRTGGIILSQMKDKSQLEEVLAMDPFHKNDLADYSITEFIPSMTSDELTCLLEV